MVTRRGTEVVTRREGERVTEGIFTLPSRYGRGLAHPAISLSCLCKTEWVYSAFVKEPAFLVHWSRQD